MEKKSIFWINLYLKFLKGSKAIGALAKPITKFLTN